MSAIPETFRDLVAFETKSFAHLSTIMADGAPQVTPVWFDFDGEHIIINSAVGRVKDRNLRRNPNVALAISDPANPYRYLQVRGQVVDISEEGAEAMIDRLCYKYTGQEVYPWRRPGEKRVTYRILPTKVQALG
jgi:PPOX class probable F420-dependent enzyme